MTTPMPAFSGGCHTNKAVDDAYATGGFPAVFKLPGGIYAARDAGCLGFVGRFDGTRYGKDIKPHLMDFLDCETNGWTQIVKGLTSGGWTMKWGVIPWRVPRCSYVAYLRGLSDLLQDNEAQRVFSTSVMRRIISTLRRAGAKAIVEGTPRNPFERAMLKLIIDAGLYAGTEPWWDRGATDLFKYPSITEERALIADMGGSVDGSIWPTNFRPFGKYDPKPMLLMSDRLPMMPERVAAMESFGWQPVPYCHQWAAAQGVKP